MNAEVRDFTIAFVTVSMRRRTVDTLIYNHHSDNFDSLSYIVEFM